MKKTKIILLVTLGVCMMSFIPAVLGQRQVNIRPISDFTDNSVLPYLPDLGLPYLPPLAGWTYPLDTYNLTMVPHGFFETIADCNPKGHVLERDLGDGRISYKVDLHVKGATTFVYWAQEQDGEVLQLLVFIGEMDYYFSATLIVYEGTLGDPVPNVWMIWFPEMLGITPIGEGTRSHLTASGTGTFTAEAQDVGLGISGESVNVKINQVGMLKTGGQELWPVEIIFFH
ncbi:MAG: hypothetical protein ACFFBI_10460 [Promethearchaeota archaeon]